MILTYFRNAVEQRTGGWVQPFVKSGEAYGITWAGLAQILQSGQPVHVRQASDEEIAAAESVIAIYRAKGGIFDLVGVQE